MAIASITQWLANPARSFSHGKTLYEQYGDNRIILAVIKTGSGSYHFAKLIEGLKAVNQKSNIEPKPIVIAPIGSLLAATKGKISPDLTSAPDKIIDIRNNRVAKYARSRQLFEKIRLADGKNNRLEMGLELLDLMDQVNQAWEIIDDWKVTGKVREVQLAETEKAVANLSVADLMREAKNLPTYITKDRKRLAWESKDAKKLKITARLEINLKRFDLIKARLEEIE